MTTIEYVQQSLDDAAVRENLARGTEALRQASRQIAGRRATTKAAKQKTLPQKLRDAVLSLGRAGAAAREAELKRKRSQRRRLILVFALLGVAVTAGLSSPARTKVSELFGGQEEVSEPSGPVETT